MRPEKNYCAFSQFTQICGGSGHCFMCDIIKSRNSQNPGIFSHHCLVNLTFHKTIRKKLQIYSYQEKYHKEYESFFKAFQALRVCF